MGPKLAILVIHQSFNLLIPMNIRNGGLCFVHELKHALITYTSIVQLMIKMILTMLIGSYAGIAISVMSFSAFMA